ncbi:enolase C-terminal domain-like protein [Actinocrinis sp.]|uniref:enolase C-terminal domain-like protein n=1 Tax=Actinocrinis sp. TaxID=1920516 RepID=UPI002D3ACE11|nr:enolase C-terminal domain-like protein [Actinocrinis sp.]HZP52069.1 enolase C-terminal domain-like protein [Actinocrinis sp.]
MTPPPASASGGPPPATDVPVEAVSAAAFTVPTESPEGDGTLTWDSTTMVMARASAAGVTGIGWTYGLAAAANVITDKLADVVRGCSALDVPAANDAMCRAVRNAGKPGLVAMAISAVDIALWDLKARVLGVPLVRLLGAARPDVPVYGSGGFTTYDDKQLEEQLRFWAEEQSIPRVKIKIGESWGRDERRDLARAEFARGVVGDEVEFYVDANGGYTRTQAIRVGRALADLGVTWFEEPVSSDDLVGLHEIRDAITPDVAAGEYGYDLPYFARMLNADAVDCLQADVTRCGGITIWQRVAAVAESLGLQISGHCAPHAHAAVAASVPNLRHLEWFHDHTRIESMFFDGTLDPSGGAINPCDNTAPGIGLELRSAVANRYRVA